MMNPEKERKKKITAALAAVSAYIKSGEEMAALQTAAVPAEKAAPLPASAPSMWGIGGRTDLMQMRNLMQLKAFHGARFR
jgi:hypothetical protein